MIKYGFFDSVGGDRVYGARDIEKVFNLIVSDGIIVNETGLSEQLKIKYYQDLQLKICAGNGIFGGHWFESTVDETITIPTPHTQYTRIDSVVVRVDENARAISFEYLQGEPDANPVAPDIQRSNSIKEYRLANITVAANVTSVSQSEIEDTRPSKECGVVTNLLQNSDISATYSQWENQFYDFLSSKDNEFNERLDAISGLDANSILALQEDVVDIRGDISTLNHVLDDNVALTNSMTSKVDGAISRADAIGADLANVTADINELKKDFSTPLWSGANQMGSGAIIRPSKKLSECKNGYMIVWTGYNSGAASNTRLNTFMVHKGMLSNISLDRIALYCPIIYTHYDTGKFDQTMKQLLIYNDRVEGFAGNTADTLSSGMCLKFIFEW